MEFPKVLMNALFILQALFFLLHSTESAPALAPAPSNSNLFSIYIGAEFMNVTFSDVPINPDVKFHFILAFAIDYTTTSSSSPSPTNGKFNVFWDSQNLSPSLASSIKAQHSNVRLALSLGGASVGNQSAYFKPTSIQSWVSNAVSSLTSLIKEYYLDGIDIDYEHFQADANTFAECIGQLVTTLKKKRVISFASIAPFDNPEVQAHYLALWRRYGHAIDYVNFQFYAYAKGTTVTQFVNYLRTQRSNYSGGTVLVSYISDGSGGLSPEKDFFVACEELKGRRELQGIFVWCADESKARGFRYEKQSQALLASNYALD